MKNGKLILIFLCIATVLVSCSGPPKRDRGQRQPPVPETTFVSTMYDRRPFNTGIERLPQGYTGHNPELLYNSIRLRQEIVKWRPGETDAQHRARIGGEISAPLLGSVDFDSTFAFTITPSKRTYDTGRKSLEVSCSLVPIFEKGLDGPKKAFMVRYQPQLDNSSVVTGKDGSERVIEEKKFSEYAIVPVDRAGVPVETRDTITTTVAMAPEEDRKTESGVMFLLIGRLQSPYASYEEVNRNPVGGASGTYLGRYHYLHIHVLDIWVYDIASGRILQKEFQTSGSTFQGKTK